MITKVNVKALLEWRNAAGHHRLVVRGEGIELQRMDGGIWNSQWLPESVRELEQELARLVAEAGRTGEINGFSRMRRLA